MIEIGQLRRWSWKNSPLPIAWEDKLFLIVEERLRWIDKDGIRHADWTFIIEGQIEMGWRGEDIEKMSVVVRSNHSDV